MSPITLEYLHANAGRIILALALIVMSRKLYSMFQVRRLFYHLHKQGLPVPKYSYATGNLQVLPELLEKVPKDTQQSEAFTLLSYKFPQFDNCFYIDVWPFTEKPMLIINSLDLAIQACQTYTLPKPATLVHFLYPFVGGPNIFSDNGPEWKRARSTFISAFGASKITQYTHHIVDLAGVYVKNLRAHAQKGDTFELDGMTCDYLMDVIGIFTINDPLNSQTGYNPLAHAMKTLLAWHIRDQEMNPLVRYNPARFWVEWYYSRKMAQYIEDALDKRFKVWQHKLDAPSDEPKSLIDLAILDYIRAQPHAQRLDSEFKKWATRQVRTFFFAGHDSTAASIVYSYYLLSKNPDALAKARAELDQVFGTDISTTSQQIKDHPELINQLPYTLAVLKEALRLFPPAGALREGMPGVFLQDKNGNKFPTDGFFLYVIHGAIQRNPAYYPDPHSFIPERWLVGPEDPLHPPKHAFRAFEVGLRDCIGQSLAWLDMKITLALTLPEFEFHDQYEEWDRQHPHKGPNPNTVFGERAYQVPHGASHPVLGMPVRVTQRQ